MSDPPYPLWSFREDVHLEPDPGSGCLLIHSRWDDLRISMPGAPLLEALRRMTLGPISLDNVLRGERERRELFRLLDGLQHLVVRSFGLAPERPLISVVPLDPQARFELPETPSANPVRLSRFALIRSDSRGYCVESPLALHRVLLHQGQAVTELGELIRPVVPAEIGRPAQEVIRYLTAAGMLVETRAGGPFQPLRFAEDTDPALALWTPFDLMFHTRSMPGRNDQDFGAVFPLGEQGAVEPVVKPPMADDAISLPRPEWDALLAADPPMTAAIEGNDRTDGCPEDPLTLGELAGLLYRTARLRSLIGSRDTDSTTTTSDRPYTSHGGSYELELYAVIDRCADLPRDAYHYDPLRHVLEPLNAKPPDVDELMEMGRVLAGLERRPPMLLIITARFRRLSWKYDGLGYSLALTNVGALTQTLSLVGTAMGVATRGLDATDVEVVARVLGLDWRVESGVGGLAVGRRAAAARAPGHPAHPVNDAEWSELARAVLTGRD
ncbi:SagB family peptide dehydrogenase [Spirillospora sp. NPDC048911]|uniref:SagB family peptide dehydrogenase n=1 Tax=Spirillospora sp. NPDC048911 TaxID=3364527 RepID=UPI0037210129